jgi:hypothetical protein
VNDIAESRKRLKKGSSGNSGEQMLTDLPESSKGTADEYGLTRIFSWMHYKRRPQLLEGQLRNNNVL